jgi:DNA-binding PadR family transcriptional regulator
LRGVPATVNMFGKGFVFQGNRISPSQFLMLVMLRKGPMYGYEILKALREEFDGLWRPETGALYPALRRLGEHGLVRAETMEEKEYYRLTVEAGSWLSETLRTIGPELMFASRYMEVLGSAAEEEQGDGPFEQVPLSFMSSHLVQDEEDPQARLAHLRQAREMLGRRLEELDIEIDRLEKR